MSNSKSLDGPIAMPLVVTFIIVALIGFLTLTPIQNSGVPGTDKSHHLIAFAALAFPLSFSRPRLAPWVVVAAIGYGGAIELIQPLVGRGQELVDFVADTAGAVSGGLLGIGLDRFRNTLG